MDDEASADTSSFLVTIERIPRLGILERVRDCLEENEETYDRLLCGRVLGTPMGAAADISWNKNLSGKIEIKR